MHDEMFWDLPADLVRRQVRHAYGSTTAVYVALSDELDELDLGGDDA